jgi:hypothetical protein
MMVNQQALSFHNVNGQKIPDEGPKSVGVPLDFSATDTYTLDLQNVIQRGFMSMVQGVYIDNSLNGSTLSISFGGTSQVIKIAPNRQGYRMVLCPNPANQIVFFTTGGVALNVQLLNFPVTNSDWPAITGA